MFCYRNTITVGGQRTSYKCVVNLTALSDSSLTRFCPARCRLAPTHPAVCCPRPSWWSLMETQTPHRERWTSPPASGRPEARPTTRKHTCWKCLPKENVCVMCLVELAYPCEERCVEFIWKVHNIFLNKASRCEAAPVSSS